MNPADKATPSFTAPGCLNCGSPVMAARNPFYGVGLAVNKYVRNCVDCSWYDFAGDAGPVRAEETGTRRRKTMHDFLTRVNAAVTILKAV